VNQDDRGRQDGSRRPDSQVLGCSSTCEPVSPTWKWHTVAPAANEVTGELFEVGPEICCSDVSSRCCRYGNYTAGSKPIWKLFIVVNGELNKVSVPKIITKCLNWWSYVILIVAVRFFKHSIIFSKHWCFMSLNIDYCTKSLKSTSFEMTYLSSE